MDIICFIETVKRCRSCKKPDRKSVDWQRSVDNDELGERDITEIYQQTRDYSKVGFAKFVARDMEFAIEGWYALKNYFNGKMGNHFCVEIRTLSTANVPEDYEDVCDYADIGFRISVAYIDEVPLSVPENENGVMLPSDCELEGITVELGNDSGYAFMIGTVEWDEMDFGEIKFLKWSDEEKIIFFKFAVASGLNDVVEGVVSLKEDVESLKTEWQHENEE